VLSRCRGDGRLLARPKLRAAQSSVLHLADFMVDDAERVGPDQNRQDTEPPLLVSVSICSLRKGGREGGRKEGREGGKEGGRKEVR